MAGPSRKPRSPFQDTIDLLVELINTPDPVSFYDARLLVRQLRKARRDPPDDVLAALVRLHDAEQTTDGGKAVLEEYLRGAAQRQHQQRSLARRNILLSDSGKTARAAAGSTLKLHLDEQRSKGYRWQVAQIHGHATVTRSDESLDYPAKAVLDVRLRKEGRVDLKLEEVRPAEIDAEDEDSQPASFALLVFAEPDD